MQISKISWSLAIYLALIEGIALLLLDLGVHAFFIGFIPAAAVLLLYKLTDKFLPFKINNQKVSDFPVIIISVLNGLFMIMLFAFQDIILRTFSHMFSPIYGFLSVFVTFFILVVVYNKSPYQISFKIGNKKTQLHQISVLFAFYAGIFEFFIMPMMIYGFSINLAGIYNGLISGLIGGAVGVLITNILLKIHPIRIR